MPAQKKVKVIIDTNVLISFLIGKKLQKIKEILVSPHCQLIITEQLLIEIKLVTSREKLKKYFDPQHVEELIEFLRLISVNIPISKIKTVCRDPKDDFLLALAEKSVADFIITGDKDLLTISVLGKTRIISPNDLNEIFKKI
ncbi:MAG: putative toxin-antitoxin system toxin component, PIN family [Sphingobacteriaceae bacterium]